MLKQALIFLLFPTFIYAQKFKEKELTSSNKTIFGTLLAPKKVKKKIPICLLISGSGPTDRDGNNSVMKNNSLKFLAEDLAKQNIASLRYDKKGVGASLNALQDESLLSFDDMVEDACGWIAQLKNDKRFSEIVIIGHSEGSLIGMIVANKMKVEKFISLAGTGYKANEILKIQLAQQPTAIKEPAFEIIDKLAKGNRVDSVSQLMQNLFRPSVQPYLISWFKYNPVEEIKKLTCPILIIQGNTDIQVSVDDANLLKSGTAQGKKVIIDQMNHVLKEVEIDRPKNMATYANATLQNHHQLIQEIVKFLK